MVRNGPYSAAFASILIIQNAYYRRIFFSPWIKPSFKVTDWTTMGKINYLRCKNKKKIFQLISVLADHKLLYWCEGCSSITVHAKLIRHTTHFSHMVNPLTNILILQSCYNFALIIEYSVCRILYLSYLSCTPNNWKPFNRAGRYLFQNSNLITDTTCTRNEINEWHRIELLILILIKTRIAGLESMKNIYFSRGKVDQKFTLWSNFNAEMIN